MAAEHIIKVEGNLHNNNKQNKDNKRKQFYLNTKKIHKNRSGTTSSSSSKPEWSYQLLICIIVLMEKLSTRLGQIASIWATTILLGGFISGLPPYDFWVISALTLASALRLFGMAQEQKLNSTSQTRRRTVAYWLYKHCFNHLLLGGPPKFHITRTTLIAGALDAIMFMLQLGSAIVSFIFAILRLSKRDFESQTSAATNQRAAMILYYSMVLVEVSLFIPAKLCWELPRPFDNYIIFGISLDKERLTAIFNIIDDYFVQVLAVSRHQSIVKGLDMSLRRHISESLLRNTIDDPAAGILALDVLYQRDEWIKRKADAEKRIKLLPVVLNHIRSPMTDHPSREAAISLLTSLLVNKTDAPEPSKFGPLVLYRAMEDKNAELLTTIVSISHAVSKYLERCMKSSSKDEVILAIRVVMRLPASFLRTTDIPRLLLEKAAASDDGGGDRQNRNENHRSKLCFPNAQKKARRSSAEVSIPALIILALSQLGLEMPEEAHVRSIILGFLKNRSLKLRELEILVGLNKCGVLTPGERAMVNVASFFRDVNFTRCLPELVEWLGCLEAESLNNQLDRLKKETRLWLVEYLRKSKGRNRPDINKLCKLLVNNDYYAKQFEELPELKELL